ncbi:MAG TPA: tetratricopeptide repeat protein [Thermoanaerobaculia bacterium]|nr:tetratricopeptide repeat protein [Thermoanaerobaculia bacterium]
MRSLILIALLAFPALAQDIPEVARSLMEEAEHARNSGRLDDAVEKYRAVIEAAPQLASAYANLGAVLHRQGKIDEAYATFARGVERAPLDRTLLSNAAATAQQLGKSAEALTYVDRAIERNRRDAALHSLRGTILRALERNDDALAAMREAVRLDPNESRYHFSVGNLLYQLGQKEAAIESYRRAVELDKTNLRAFYNLGAVLFEAGRDSEALGAYKVALEPIEKAFAKNETVEPIHAQAYANLGAIYIRQKQWPLAVDAYAKSLRLDPESASAHYNLGFINYSIGKFDLAEREYRSALDGDPNLPLAYLHLAQIALRRGDGAASAKLLRDGMPRFDRDSKIIALRTLGRAELSRGDRAAAATAFEENASDLESQLPLGRIYRQDHRYEDAKRVLEQAQRAVPDNRALLFERVLLARDANDAAAERATLEELLRHDPNRADLWPLRAELAFLLVRLGTPADAKKQIDTVIATAPLTQSDVVSALRAVRALLVAREGKIADAAKALQDRTDPIARGNLGLMLWQLGRGAEAKPHLIMAQAMGPAWTDVTLAAGEIALSERDYDRAVDLLAAAARCDANLEPDLFELSATSNCNRAKQSLGIALLAQAAEQVDRRATRTARQLIERATELPLTNRAEAAANFLRGDLEILSGSLDDARSAFSKASAGGLESLARRYLTEIAEATKQPEREPELVSDQPRRTVMVFLPDAPAENEKKLAETMTAMVSQIASSSGVPLSTEFFRRGDDARAYFAANRERIGLVISNTEFISDLTGELRAKFQFSKEGRQTYRRVLVVPAASRIQSLADLRGKTLSVPEGLRDVSGSGATVVRTADDLTAVANALYGRTDAALASEANPLIDQRLRVVYTSGSFPLPVVAFAPMPEADREAMTRALRSMSAARVLAPMQITGLVALEPAERAPAKEIEVTPVSAASLGLTAPSEAPASVAYRVALKSPRVAIPENLYE